MINNPIRYEENFAYSKPFPNNLVISRTYRGNDMSKENDSLERKQNGMKVTLLFPKKPTEEESIKDDVRMIFANILREYLTNVS